MQIDLINLGTVVLIPVVRSVGGWATNALKDGKVSNFELKLLAETVLKTGIYGGMIFFGAEGFGFDVSVVSAGVSAVILDMVLGSLKENKNVTKR